jgi:hypothetical protein
MPSRPRKNAVTQAVTKPDFAALLSKAKLPESVVQVCLRGDLAADFDVADKALTEAQKRPSTGKEDAGITALLERVEQIQAEMAESTYPFRMRALDRPAFRALMADFPPRRNPETGDPDPEDAQVGFDRDAFFHALLKAATVDPVLDDAGWDELLPKLTDRQYGDLTDAAWFVNRSEVSVPFSLAASRARRPSADE